VSASAIHGNKSQGQREQALAAFRSGNARVLVATDIAARGIDVEGITHVINFELPNIPESYVHRIGRTARAGAAGAAISFCDAEERDHLRGIETLIRRRLPAERHGGSSGEHIEAAAPIPVKPTARPARKAATPRPVDAKAARTGSPKPADAPKKPAGAAKSPRPKRAGTAAAASRPAGAPAARSAGRAEQPLRRLDGMGRVMTAPVEAEAASRHDLSHLSFLAPAASASRR
ncbi:MAG: hypothetical protein JNM48_09600, partial [Rhodospirillales bacterium]|nr:hypothetical protein [Rhodospirillales bacterium]